MSSPYKDDTLPWRKKYNLAILDLKEKDQQIKILEKALEKNARMYIAMSNHLEPWDVEQSVVDQWIEDDIKQAKNKTGYWKEEIG